jgi:Glycosyltransferase (GlcNAc)
LTIFVSIAAYRDPELVPTIKDCLEKAGHPDDLHVGVCWQHGPEEAMISAAYDNRVDVIDVDWHESKGACWARAELMKLWSGEDYYLQIDSHHRFVSNWDVRLIEQAQLTQSAKPLITTYCQEYSPSTNQPLSTLPTKIAFGHFTADGIPLCGAVPVGTGGQVLRGPLRSRFVSAHFLFTTGSFVREVEYDPSLYFCGEEITLAVRAYTWGYDLFHPSEAILFHQYSREGRAAHWSDHSAGVVEVPWYERDRLSRERVAGFLRDEPMGRFGCGPRRTVAQYEAYAGIDFRRRMVQDYTFLGKEPPNPIDDQWLSRDPRRVMVELERSHLPVALAEAESWRVSVHDATGVQVHEADLRREVLNEIFADRSPLIHIRLELEPNSSAEFWRIRSSSDGTCLTGRIREERISKSTPTGVGQPERLPAPHEEH